MCNNPQFKLLVSGLQLKGKENATLLDLIGWIFNIEIVE